MVAEVPGLDHQRFHRHSLSMPIQRFHALGIGILGERGCTQYMGILSLFDCSGNAMDNQFF
ncbi:hypothetical protein Taro_035543 [Colocasia esculenta]|uniref:Uncharacterized protein n=1 Tax=Colocasia esculenta TaxID=4460 RepID=A0A843WDI3_COLES|nr:hypothetical protein [Colocasia esculenta]